MGGIAAAVLLKIKSIEISFVIRIKSYSAGGESGFSSSSRMIFIA
jgi:hypothetical protein